ncbi:recombinase family protein [Citreimonas salinaria]|uniref:recombinase family protein n=1 Tax=Citreimonas salinaria TaxID=321339 RepID=UPI003CCB939D
MGQEKLTETLALIYCRVSSHKQTVQGHGLKSQEARCREFAHSKGYQVVAVFFDDISGSSLVRPGMTQLISHVNNDKSASYVVLIDDISRLARGLEAHLAMRASLQGAGARLESPSVSFGDDSDAVLVENLLASVSQHHRQKNSEQTHNRMRGRLLNGYWPFRAPTGYRAVSQKGFGKVLIADEVEGPVIREALEGFATGRLKSQAEVTRFLNSHPVFERSKAARFKQDHIKAILSNFLYAGLVGREEWGVDIRQGNHEALISVEMYDRIQKRLTESAYGSVRIDASEDFPLRGFVECGECGGLLTACWSRSKTGRRYPYYYCRKSGCAMKYRHISKTNLEKQFIALMKSIEPEARVMEVAARMFSDAWEARKRCMSSARGELRKRLTTVQQDIERFLRQIVETENLAVRNAYERKITDLECEKLRIEDRVQRIAVPKLPFEKAFELSMALLASPSKIWKKGDHAARIAVLRLAFQGPLQFTSETGFQTPQTAFPYKALADATGADGKMAARRGIEPLFPG